jgi:membrane protein involved in colicin uptake
MFAKERLFHTADKSKLVRENDAEAAFLYANTGDEIPQSAADMYGLDDGALPGFDADAASDEDKAAADAAIKQAEDKAAADAKAAADKAAEDKAAADAKAAADKAAEDKAAADAANKGGNQSANKAAK